MHTVSASPSYPYSYEQKPIEDRRFYTRQTDPSSHASATPDYRPMNNMGYSVDQHGTLHRLEDVSRFYSSDEGIGYGSGSYVADYSQPSYTSPHGISYSTPDAYRDFHESVRLLGCSLLYGNSTGVQVPTQVIATNSTSQAPLQNFGTPQPNYPTEDAAANTGDFTTPTWEQLSDEQH